MIYSHLDCFVMNSSWQHFLSVTAIRADCFGSSASHVLCCCMQWHSSLSYPFGIMEAYLCLCAFPGCRLFVCIPDQWKQTWAKNRMEYFSNLNNTKTNHSYFLRVSLAHFIKLLSFGDFFGRISPSCISCLSKSSLNVKSDDVINETSIGRRAFQVSMC